MRTSSTNIGIVGFFEKNIRKHPLIYIIFRSLVRFTNIFEKDFDGLKKILFNKKINIIDVGASDGISAKFFLNNLKVNKIFCFEPYKNYIKILKKNKKLIVKPYAIGDKNIKKTIFFPRYNFLGKKFDFITYAHYDQNLLNHFINDFHYQKNLSIARTTIKIKKIKDLKFKIDLIKIDTNGFEYNVIKGLMHIIKKHRPVLIIEINRDERKINKLLKKYNYNDYYYSLKKKSFSKKKDLNCTNKYLISDNFSFI